VRQDSSFAEKQESHPALLLVVPTARLSIQPPWLAGCQGEPGLSPREIPPRIGWRLLGPLTAKAQPSGRSLRKDGERRAFPRIAAALPGLEQTVESVDAPPPGCAAGRLASYGPLVDAVVANTSVRLARLPLLARTWNGLKPGLRPPPAKSRPA